MSESTGKGIIIGTFAWHEAEYSDVPYIATEEALALIGGIYTLEGAFGIELYTAGALCNDIGKSLTALHLTSSILYLNHHRSTGARSNMEELRRAARERLQHPESLSDFPPAVSALPDNLHPLWSEISSHNATSHSEVRTPRTRHEQYR